MYTTIQLCFIFFVFLPLLGFFSPQISRFINLCFLFIWVIPVLGMFFQQISRKRRKKFKNITKLFFQFLLDEANNPESVFNCMSLGMRRAGKTAKAMVIIDKLMTDPKRKLCLFRAPHELYMALNKHSPWGFRDENIANAMNAWFGGSGYVKMKNRIYEAASLDKIENDSIVYMDESLVSANAKEALKTDLRELGKSNAYWSHKRIILLMNAQDGGIIKDLRNKSELKIYSRLSMPFLENSKDPFIIANRDRLKKLKRERGLIDANLFHFTKRGYIEFDLLKECPWWHTEISMNLKDANTDALMEQTQQKQDQLTPIVETIIKDLGVKQIKKSSLGSIIRGYLIENHLDWYNKFKSSVTEIEARCKYRATLMKDEKQQKEAEEVQAILDGTTPSVFADGDGFGQYVLNNMPKKKRANEIFQFLVQGVPQSTIRDTLNIGSAGKLNGIIHEYSEKQIGYFFEDWFAATHGGGPVAHESHDPDYIDPRDGKVYSLKYRYNGDKTLSFYQSKNFGPEYKHILKNKKEGKEPLEYYAVLYNPRWKKNQMTMKKVDPINDIDKVIFERK